MNNLFTQQFENTQAEQEDNCFVFSMDPFQPSASFKQSENKESNFGTGFEKVSSGDFKVRVLDYCPKVEKNEITNDMTVGSTENKQNKSDETDSCCAILSMIDDSFEVQEQTFGNLEFSEKPVTKRKTSQKFTRWGKEEDRELFKKIRELCRSMSIDINNFYRADYATKMCYKDLLNELLVGINWKGTPELLMKRIHKFTSKQSVSVREGKAIRKVINSKFTESDLSIEELSYYLPGRTTEILENFIQKEISKRFN